jgi:hypothetical protein
MSSIWGEIFCFIDIYHTIAAEKITTITKCFHWSSCYLIFLDLRVVFCLPLIVFLLYPLVIVLSVFLRFTTYYYPFLLAIVWSVFLRFTTYYYPFLLAIVLSVFLSFTTYYYPVNLRKTDNAMAKRKRTERQTMIYKTQKATDWSTQTPQIHCDLRLSGRVKKKLQCVYFCVLSKLGHS